MEETEEGEKGRGRALGSAVRQQKLIWESCSNGDVYRAESILPKGRITGWT